MSPPLSPVSPFAALGPSAALFERAAPRGPAQAGDRLRALEQQLGLVATQEPPPVPPSQAWERQVDATILDVSANAFVVGGA